MILVYVWYILVHRCMASNRHAANNKGLVILVRYSDTYQNIASHGFSLLEVVGRVRTKLVNICFVLRDEASSTITASYC